MLRDFKDWLLDWWLPVIIILAMAAFLVMIGVALVKGAEQWAAFKEEHHCRVVGRVSGDLLTSFTSNGQLAFTSTPDKTGWACDDGVTYWR